MFVISRALYVVLATESGFPPRTSQSVFFPQRAAAAFFAIADRCSLVRDWALALPPSLPPRFPCSRKNRSTSSGIRVFFATNDSLPLRGLANIMLDMLVGVKHNKNDETRFHFRFLPHLRHAFRAPPSRIRRRRRLRLPGSPP